MYKYIYIGMRLQVKVTLANETDEEFVGGGLLQLLEGIAQHGSIHQAARDMELSYVKALRILNRLERELGETLLVRHKGGAARGSSELTAFARSFMRDFTELRRKIRRAADRSYQGFQKKYERKRT